MVYAADNQVGLAWQYLLQGYFHAVYRRAGACVDSVLYLPDAYGMCGGYAAGRAASGTVRSHDDAVAEPLH